jgi:hypothetical protein
MNQVYKSKSQVRVETSEALQDFLARGGQVQIVPAKKRRKRTEQKMSGKTTRVVNPNNSLGFRSSSF